MILINVCPFAWTPGRHSECWDSGSGLFDITVINMDQDNLPLTPGLIEEREHPKWATVSI